MATEKAIYELDELLCIDVDVDYYLVIDDSTFAEPKKVSLYCALKPERDLREAADTAIIDGAGLEADGSYAADASTNYITPADFAAAALDETIANALILLDAAIYDAAQNLICTEYTFTAAELTGLNVTPVTVLNSMGAGIFINPIDITGWLPFNTTAYSTGSDLKFRFVGGLDLIMSVSQTFTESTDTVYFKGHVYPDVEMLTNTAIEAYVDDAMTLGDSPITVRICYNGVDTVAGSSVTPSTGCCVTSYTTTFVNADLAAGWIEFNHNLGSSAILVGYWNENDEKVEFETFLGRNSTGYTHKTTWISAYCDVLPAGTFRVVVMAKNT
jgi:hypothetical protein